MPLPRLCLPTEPGFSISVHRTTKTPEERTHPGLLKDIPSYEVLALCGSFLIHACFGDHCHALVATHRVIKTLIKGTGLILFTEAASEGCT